MISNRARTVIACAQPDLPRLVVQNSVFALRDVALGLHDVGIHLLKLLPQRPCILSGLPFCGGLDPVLVGFERL